MTYLLIHILILSAVSAIIWAVIRDFSSDLADEKTLHRLETTPHPPVCDKQTEYGLVFVVNPRFMRG